MSACAAPHCAHYISFAAWRRPVQLEQVPVPADSKVDDLDVPLPDLRLLEHDVSLMQAALRIRQCAMLF